MKLVIQKKSISEFEEIEKSIIENDQSFEQMYETWKILDDFFVQNQYEKDLDWRWTYFRVYVRLTWKVLGTILDTNKFIEIMRRQVPMALMLDIDVLKEMMWYLQFNRADENKLVSLYQKIKTAFLESEQIVGTWQGKDIMVKDLVSEYLLMHNRGASSMEGAEFLSKLEQVMFPEVADPYVFTEFEVGIDRFLELVEFFEKTPNEQIWIIVDAFLDPEKYSRGSEESFISEQKSSVKNEDSQATNVSVVQEEKPKLEEQAPQNLGAKYESMSQKLDEEVKALEKTAAPVAKPEPEKPVATPLQTVEPVVEKSQPRMSDSQIKNKIEIEFKKDAEGNFEDIEGVMRKLEEFAEMYNEPKIADLIYFDEDEGKFNWKI